MSMENEDYSWMNICPNGLQHAWKDDGKFFQSLYEPSLESGSQKCVGCGMKRHVMREIKMIRNRD